tara:strand:+ start:182 stop:385 length:204 start_codon:yes stop_codon:yes gene_type:complete
VIYTKVYEKMVLRIVASCLKETIERMENGFKGASIELFSASCRNLGRGYEQRLKPFALKVAFFTFMV